MSLTKRYRNSSPERFRYIFNILLILSCLQLISTKSFVKADDEILTDSHQNSHKIIDNINIDENLQNYDMIINKFIPDISIILNSNNIEFDNIKKYINNIGLNKLETEGYQIKKDLPFTIIIPKIDLKSIENNRLKEFLLEHLIPGKIFNFDKNDNNHFYGNSNGHKILISKTDNGKWLLNDIKIIHKYQINDNLMVITIDGFLGDRKTTAFSKRNIQEHNRYNEPERLEMKNSTKSNEHPKEAASSTNIKLSPLMIFLSGMKSGTKVFQHFLLKSNLTQIMDDNHYTILIPSDNAFQRWHPIDWGFYPFSVHEFTENILRNHFLQTQSPLKMSDIKNSNKMILKTLGGEQVIFKNNPSPSVNNVTILSDYTLANGNQVFIISEVLFVSEAVVSKLHQMHKDKETPPLLAFPWFGAQFLSHSFLALERDPMFTQITRYLNNAEVAPYISGANYTFFVPIDSAFEKLGYDLIPDDILASPKGVKMLLHHFVKGRLYDRDLLDNEVFETIGGGSIKIQRKLHANLTYINSAKIVESEIFVYNLGTMFYIDEILYSDILKEAASVTTKPNQGTISSNSEASGNNNNGDEINSKRNNFATPNLLGTDVEIIPNEFITEQGDIGDSLNQSNDDDDEDFDDEVITPKALPVRFNSPPKK